MEQFPSNSNNKRTDRSRDEPKRVERVVQSEVVRRKTPLGRRMTQNLIGGDVQSVWGYVFGEVLIPAARDMVADAVSGGVERMIFGDSSNSARRSRNRGGSSGHTSYNQMSQRPSNNRYGRDEPRREISNRARSSHTFDEIILKTRVEAEEVLDRMDALIDKYEAATVADFYELCGVSGNYTDNKYGWFELRGASISHVRGGYLMNMPKPEPLE